MERDRSRKNGRKEGRVKGMEGGSSWLAEIDATD